MIEVSILLPSLRPDQLAVCLNCIASHTGGVSYEVVVIGPAKPMDIPGWIPANVRLIEERERLGVVHALMEGYRASHGEFVVPMSDEARVQDNWLLPALIHARKNMQTIGAFNVQPSNPFTYWGKKFSPFALISKQRCEEIGGFMDEGYRGFYADPDLSLRNYQHGGDVMLHDDCVIYHPYRNDTIHQVSIDAYLEKDRARFIEKWEPVYGKFLGDP